MPNELSVVPRTRDRPHIDRAVDQPAAQMRLGAVTGELAAARAGWEAAIDELDSYVGTGDVTVERRMALRLAAAVTVRAARSIVHTIAEGAGASVFAHFSTSVGRQPYRIRQASGLSALLLRLQLRWV